MKTTATLKSDSFLKRNLSLIFGFLFFYLLLTLFALGAFSQNSPGKDVVAQRDSDNKTIVSFSAKIYEGKAYLNWLSLGQKKDCAFFILRSQDGVEYKVIDFVDGFAINAKVPILHCYTDSNPLPQYSFYKIKIFEFENSKHEEETPNGDLIVSTKKESLPENKNVEIQFGSSDYNMGSVSSNKSENKITASKKNKTNKNSKTVAFAVKKRNQKISDISVSDTTAVFRIDE